MKLLLLRHTSVDIPSGVCYGQTDVGLADSYDHELEKIRSLLTGIEVTRIFSSPLKRCAVLAGDIAPYGVEVSYDRALMELNFGNWEMQKWNDISKSNMAKLWFNDYVNVRCPGGEAYTDLLKRVDSFIYRLSMEYTGGNLLVVTHAGVIRAFYSLIESVGPCRAFSLNIRHGEMLEFTVSHNYKKGYFQH